MNISTILMIVFYATGIALAIRYFFRFKELIDEVPGFVFSNSASLAVAVAGFAIFPALGFIVSGFGNLYMEEEFKKYVERNR